MENHIYDHDKREWVCQGCSGPGEHMFDCATRIRSLEDELADLRDQLAEKRSHINYHTCHECPCQLNFNAMKARVAALEEAIRGYLTDEIDCEELSSGEFEECEDCDHEGLCAALAAEGEG